ncbi:MAG: hypothetical protein JW982_00585 [Spirochaetes bacterium]|nr:hypothetical protein [Spirochaetota bacterium]
MDIKKEKNLLFASLMKTRNLLIYIKGSPDPDALASAFALQLICESLKIKSEIVSPMQISLAQNLKFIKTLHIPVKFTDIKDFSKYDSYAILDYPVADLDVQHNMQLALHIDHHKKTQNKIAATYSLLNDKVNAVSTIFTLLLMEINPVLPKETSVRLYTALLFGQNTDIGNMAVASEYDREAHRFLEEQADTEIISELNESLYSEETLTILSKAILNHETYKSWLITGVGYIPHSLRDSIAISADFLLEREDVTTVIVFSLIENKADKKLYLDASLRTKNHRLDLNNLIKSITPNGGGRNFKGAYQINLDYFHSSENKTELWEIANRTTRAIFRDKRDTLGKIEISGFFKKIKEDIKSIFRK